MRFFTDRRPLRVAVVGFGHVGACLGVTLAGRGMTVTGIDTDAALVAELRAGRCRLREPGLAEVLAALRDSPRLRLSTGYGAVADADVVVLTVGTPLGDAGAVVADHLEQSCRALAPRLRAGQLVVVKSTVPPGTTRRVLAPLLEGGGLRQGRDFGLAYCPERLAEGTALRDLRELPVVVGGLDADSAAAAVAFWKEALDVPVHVVPDAETAEIVKLATNWWIDVNIAVANELARFCAAYDTDVLEVVGAANALPKGTGRVNLLLPGVGVGGSCLTKDPWIAWRAADAHGVELETVATARRVNDAMPARCGALIAAELARLGSDPAASTVAVLGLAYKNDTGDLRHTPVRGVVDTLRSAGAAIRLHDPLADPDEVRACFGQRPVPTLDEAVTGADCVAVLAGHRQYRELDYVALRDRVAMPCLVFDGRLHLPPPTIADLLGLGYAYRGVGR
ncbi:nucleotide sugar dehydrogenase [Micromonospora olivasterospora]|uniref:UDP-N-acetyl-D-mannosaminuronic acid dehydrogenase n=1 Tax=Micromonospora olivasterospora TaxID=1880 RepID=A0A562I342_MICOL|nr:nucleotide sugar dehydrogenase [Micromonospora olivasterospora]TWH65118.1 UDP-N-acetyl-D-mannosaminuronic acid dehydrogenase [Micromonospora olivasterospora]